MNRRKKKKNIRVHIYLLQKNQSYFINSTKQLISKYYARVVNSSTRHPLTWESSVSHNSPNPELLG
jgi:hypothetical protein